MPDHTSIAKAVIVVVCAANQSRTAHDRTKPRQGSETILYQARAESLSRPMATQRFDVLLFCVPWLSETKAKMSEITVAAQYVVAVICLGFFRQRLAVLSQPANAVEDVCNCTEHVLPIHFPPCRHPMAVAQVGESAHVVNRAFFH